MSNKVYVGNLSYGVDESALETKFNEFGTVKAVNIITDRETGRCKGFAFIEMGDESQAQNAVDNANSTEFLGRPMKVSIAKERAPRDNSRNRY